MRQWKVLPIYAALLVLQACTQDSKLARDNSRNLGDSIADSSATRAKSDRPTEAGEGLPGYLIDPSKLDIESQNGLTTIRGRALALRSLSGDGLILVVSLIKLNKSTVRLQKAGPDWTLAGKVLASGPSSAEGAFNLQGSVGNDELLFIKAASAEDPLIQYQANSVNPAVLWIEGLAAKNLDQNASAQIEAQLASAQTENGSGLTTAQMIEQVKTTGQCRNCDLRGADFSGLTLSKCDLSYSNVAGAKFTQANLADCRITNSNLSQTDFTQANLTNANLSLSDITGAVFAGAQLNGVVGQQIPSN